MGDLADAATEGLVDGGKEVAHQDSLPGTDHAKVKFVGMAWETLDIPDIREEVELVVKGIVVGHGEDLMKDSIRKTAKIKVTSVTRK